MATGFSGDALSKKVYAMRRNADGSTVVVVEQKGEKPLKHVVRHSPAGFEWGYGGSGPADLALSILTDALGAELADSCYQDFKWSFISCLPREGGEITGSQILTWLWERAYGIA